MNLKKTKPGILAFQGDIEEHEAAILSLGLSSIRVKTKQDLNKITHLIIPGGESTVMSKFIKMLDLKKEIQNRVQAGTLAVYGTCAGMILASSKVNSPFPIENLSLINLETTRNAYGSQIDSFEKEIKFLPTKTKFKGIFIRAPKVSKIGEGVEVLAKDGDLPILFRQGIVMVSSFHPEYCRPAIVHQWFLEMEV